MVTTQKSTRILADVQVNIKLKLSALWVALMFLYTYGDILGFYTPGILEQIMAGEVGGVQITEVLLLVMSIWMTVSSVMIFLALVLKANANRWTNIVMGVISMLVLGATFFAGQLSARYVIHALVEAVLIGLIIWHAWRWPYQG